MQVSGHKKEIKAKKNDLGEERSERQGFRKAQINGICRVKCWEKDNYTKTEL